MKDRQKSGRISGLRAWLGEEVGIEYKACLYFFCILFFHCCRLALRGVYSAEMLHMAEMIVLTYAMGYFQVYALRRFDEADRLGLFEWFAILLCTALYTGASWLLGWFGREPLTTALFAGYMLVAFICANIVNRLKREFDTRELNELLDEYKHNGGDEE